VASDTGSGLPEGRTTGRHAAPRLTVRGRMQQPVGRVLALTAVPTALLMGSIAPKLAFAADAKASPASTSHDTASAATAVTGGSCVKTSLKSLEAGTTTTTAGTATGTGTASSKAQPSGNATGRHSASSGGTSTTPSKKATPVTTEPTATSTSSPAPSPTSTTGSSGGGSTTTDPVTGILNGLGNLLGLDRTTASGVPAASPTAAPKAAAAAAAPAAAVAPVKAPVAAPTPVKTTHQPVAGPTPSPVSGGGSTTTGPTTSAEANKPCDISNLAAPLDTSVSPGEMPSVPWTLKSSNLELIDNQFWGVVTVQTTAGPVRVLKFTAQAVNIGDLDMSTTQINQELHVQGGPGTTSTMTGGTVTMYVTSLSGTLASAEGIPLGWLGVNLTLTPDTLPQWLYDLIGSVPIPLTMSFTNAVAVQTGQFGGNLMIPGMHLYYTPPTS
jgi:hypothetical protein